jgi:hypothetical protein
MFEDPAEPAIQASLERHGLIRRGVTVSKGNFETKETLEVTTFGQALVRLLSDDFSAADDPAADA